VTGFTVTVPTVDDVLNEPTETLPLTIGGVTGVGSIIDNDGTPSLSIDSVSVNESAGTATFIVTLSAASGQAISVDYASANGSATAGSDYAAVSGTLNFAAGETTKTITVNITDDNLFEGSENFIINLSNPSNAVIGTPTGTGTIVDNDSAPTVSSISSPSITEGGNLVYSVALSNPSTTVTSLAYSLGGGGAEAADIGTPTFSDGVILDAGNLIIPAGVTSFTVTVPTVDDVLHELTETLPLTIDGVTGVGSILDNDAVPLVSVNSISVNESAGTATFIVSLSAPSSQAISVDYASANGSATAGSDYAAVSGTLSFAAGETTKTITVSITDDNLFEGSESFTIQLSNPTNSMLGTATGTGTIVDNDSAPTVSSISSPSITEGGNLVYSVTLSNPSTTVTSLAYSLGGGGAEAADIGTPTFSDGVILDAGNLIIPAGVTSFTVTVPTVDDVLNEPTETLPLTIGGVTGVGSIVDNDVAPVNTPPVANNDLGVDLSSSHGLYSEYFSYREGTDGLNLTNLNQVQNFIQSHTATATFTSTNLNYNLANSFNNNLGQGTNLQTFLGADAASLSSDPANSSDAIIRMRGFIELNPGTYNFRILSDDGYQVKIDGKTVAQVDVNQSSTATTHSQFTISTGGIHTMEIIYWDQGKYAIFSAEISDNSGVTYSPFSAFTSYQHITLNAVEDTAFSIPASSLLANDTDADGDTLTIQSVQGALHGSVALVAGSVVFTPAANYSGPASFTYTVSDGNGGTSTATVNLVVAPVNDAPVAVGDTLVLAADLATNIPAATLLSNDADVDGDVLSILSVQGAVNGVVTLLDNSVTFTPVANFEGPASFTYTAQDSFGLTSTATVNLTVGSASAVSVAVSKSIVVNAQGTGGASVSFPIMTKLVDNDGSETLSIKVSGVPTGASFNAGTNLGGGVWSFVESDLANLKLNVPGSYASSIAGDTLTVAVTTTELNGGDTQTTTTTLRLHADYTTTSTITTDGGNHTGNSADNYIQGGADSNTISGGSGNDLIYGRAGNDTLNGDAGHDVIYGEAGDDNINGGTGADYISGGAGNDTLNGGTGNDVDVFAWSLGDQGAAGSPAVDVINSFGTAAAGLSSGGDVLDLRDLLQGESIGSGNGAGNLADYLHFEVTGGDTIVHVSHTGGFTADSHTVSAGFTGGAETQKIVLSGVDLQSLYSGATTDQQIITQLLNNNKLITD
jgi:hypothetical protein